jgi:arginyl-tRNA synthetase
MASIIDLLSGPILEIVADQLGEEVADSKGLRVNSTTNPKFGDYQFNGAMGLAKKVGRPPREIAQELAARLEGMPWLERVEVAGPGFVNLRLSGAWLSDRIEEAFQDDRIGVERLGKGQTVVVDFSSPNVAKPMHIGHVRSTILGFALDRIHRFLGFDVIADNHVGDWGTQFGILLVGYRRLGDPEAFEKDPIEELERVYVEGYRKAQQDPSLMEEARGELVRLQQGDPENRKLWEKFVQASLQEFDRIYERLGIAFDVTLGESFYNDRLQALVDDLEERGIASRSDGALVVFLEEEGLPPFIIQKSDGGFNYATTDIAAMLYRIERWQPSKILYVTDEGQQLHFHQLFAVARRIGIKVELEHIWFGIMRLPEGKFSTRDGNVIRLETFMDEAERRAYEVAHRLNPGLEETLKKEIARKVGLGVLRYADMSQNRQSAIEFRWEKALSLEGNSAPYLQYTYARIQSVFRKYREEHDGGGLLGVSVSLEEDLERQVAKAILEFPEHLYRSAGSYKPNQLTDYLFDLASLYNRFYQNVPFLKAPDGIRESRLVLCDLVGRIIRTGLGLLGIEVPEQM